MFEDRSSCFCKFWKLLQSTQAKTVVCTTITMSAIVQKYIWSQASWFGFLSKLFWTHRNRLIFKCRQFVDYFFLLNFCKRLFLFLWRSFLPLVIPQKIFKTTVLFNLLIFPRTHASCELSSSIARNFVSRNCVVHFIKLNELFDLLFAQELSSNCFELFCRTFFSTVCLLEVFDWENVILSYFCFVAIFQSLKQINLVTSIICKLFCLIAWPLIFMILMNRGFDIINICCDFKLDWMIQYNSAILMKINYLVDGFAFRIFLEEVNQIIDFDGC